MHFQDLLPGCNSGTGGAFCGAFERRLTSVCPSLCAARPSQPLPPKTSVTYGRDDVAVVARFGNLKAKAVDQAIAVDASDGKPTCGE